MLDIVTELEQLGMNAWVAVASRIHPWEKDNAIVARDAESL